VVQDWNTYSSFSAATSTAITGLYGRIGPLRAGIGVLGARLALAVVLVAEHIMRPLQSLEPGDVIAAGKPSLCGALPTSKLAGL
jgi:hypothetical protein